MNRGKTTKIFATVGVPLLMSCAVNADFLSPPEFKPNDEEYQKLELACGSSITRDAGDVVYGLNDKAFFFRSGQVTAEIDDKDYYETFFVATAEPKKCVKLLTDDRPLFGSAVKASSSAEFETVVLNTPKGRVEVKQSGEILELK